jgi:hypothetical protein
LALATGQRKVPQRNCKKHQNKIGSRLSLQLLKANKLKQEDKPVLLKFQPSTCLVFTRDKVAVNGTGNKTVVPVKVKMAKFGTYRLCTVSTANIEKETWLIKSLHFGKQKARKLTYVHLQFVNFSGSNTPVPRYKGSEGKERQG